MGLYQKAEVFAGLPVVPYQPLTGIVLPVMPRVELRSHARPDEYWAITLEGRRVVLESGEAGRAGRRRTRTSATPEAAQDRYRALVAKKVAARWGPTPARRTFLRAGERMTRSWTIAVSGKQRVVWKGQAGEEGRATARNFKTADDAEADAERLIARKVAEGYVEQRPPARSLREALLDAVRADPDDLASRNAFLDHLAEQGELPPPAAHKVDGDRYGESGFRALRAFLADPAVGLVEALVVGCCWGVPPSPNTSAEVVAALLAARERMPRLRALFLGHITSLQNELSWIRQSDLTPLLTGLPHLEHFRSRGGVGLVLRKFRHEHLKSLAIEASNLPRAVVRAVGASHLPALEHLELWLGTKRYGADTTPGDLKGVLQGDGLPSLRHLGLRDSDIADAVARALARAPILGRLRSLDLSLGTLGDRGAEALLANPAVAQLERLDIRHHFVSPEMVERLRRLGPQVEADDRCEERDHGDGTTYRYVAHAE
jgi:predicted DNA-binding WGR domain protein